MSFKVNGRRLETWPEATHRASDPSVPPPARPPDPQTASLRRLLRAGSDGKVRIGTDHAKIVISRAEPRILWFRLRHVSILDEKYHRFQQDILACLPRVRALARSLGRNGAEADDLVQGTVMRALAAQHRFEPGTNLMGWLYTIMRNVHTSELRARSVRAHQDIESTPDYLLQRPPTQLDAIEHREVRNAMKAVPLKQREALILIVMVGCSYEEAAAICCCEVGTIKSRVNRAKTRIAEALGRGEAVERRRVLVTRRSGCDEARRTRVLIVEDELVIAKEYERMIAELGGTAVGKAGTATDAAALADQYRPDLLLMDVKLRGPADGITAAHQILAKQKTSIAFVTGYDDEATRRRMQLCSGSVLLRKPLGLHDLAAAMYAATQREYPKAAVT